MYVNYCVSKKALHHHDDAILSILDNDEVVFLSWRDDGPDPTLVRASLAPESLVVCD
jgi:hypothetical protein